jgi:hypothetical protein
MSIRAKVVTQNTINAQVNPDKKIVPKQVSSGGGGAALTDGDGISDLNYNGASPKTISVDDTVLRTTDDTVVKTTGDQTIEGTKTFTDTGLNQLSDVTITSVGDDDLIKYDGSSSKFINTNIMDGGNF